MLKKKKGKVGGTGQYIVKKTGSKHHDESQHVNFYSAFAIGRTRFVVTLLAGNKNLELLL